jgi:hypothetical protein
MATPQSGILALGTASHAYLEFEAREPGQTGELLRAVASLRDPRTTIGGINLVGASSSPTTLLSTSRASTTMWWVATGT